MLTIIISINNSHTVDKFNSHFLLAELNFLFDRMFVFNYLLFSYKLIPIFSKVEKHHLIVRRFNTDAKIFCLLISSRTPFLGGFDWPMADAVILYDIDLSPSMARHEMKLLRAMAQASSLTVFKLVILSLLVKQC